jgi:hypothetical protein
MTAGSDRYSPPQCILRRVVLHRTPSIGWGEGVSVYVITRLIQNVVREIQSESRKKDLSAIALKNMGPMCLSVRWMHLFSRGRGPSFVREPRQFPVRVLLRAVRCVLRNGVRFFSDASGIGGARITTRAFTSLPREHRLRFNNHASAAARCGRLV